MRRRAAEGIAAGACLLVLAGCSESPPNKPVRFSAIRQSQPELDEQEPSQRELTIAYWNRIRIPTVNFENTTVEDAVEYFRQRSAEIEPPPGWKPPPKGVSYVVRPPESERVDAGADVSLEAALGGLGEAEQLPDSLRIPVYRARHVLLKDALADICKMVSLDCYVTSEGTWMLPEGEKPKGEIWMVIREAK